MSKKSNFYAFTALVSSVGYFIFVSPSYALCVPVAGIVFRCPLDIDFPPVLQGGIQAFPSGRIIQLFTDEDDPNNPRERNIRRSRPNTDVPVTVSVTRLNYTNAEVLKDVATATVPDKEEIKKVPQVPSPQVPGALD